MLCYESLKHSKQRYISKDLLEHSPFEDKFICATPSAYGGEGIKRFIIISPGEVFSKSYIGFICDSKD